MIITTTTTTTTAIISIIIITNISIIRHDTRHRGSASVLLAPSQAELED